MKKYRLQSQTLYLTYLFLKVLFVGIKDFPLCDVTAEDSAWWWLSGCTSLLQETVTHEDEGMSLVEQA